MAEFLSWYLLVTLLGLLTFPLAFYLFPALADRGYIFSRSLGLLVWGYTFWLFASFRLAQNDIGGLLLGLVILGGLSALAYLNCQVEIAAWFREHRRLVLTTEGLFLLALGFMSFVRAANPEIAGTEKPMELMFINGIMNSPSFPPRDLWLSDYAISYYYFGYVMTSMLAMFTGVPATIAFNLMISLIFALSALGAYGIIYNLLAANHFPPFDVPHTVPMPFREDRLFTPPSEVTEQQASNASPLSSFLYPLLGPLFLLLVSNAEGFLEVLHRRGLLWTGTQNFWTWLDIPELREAPAQPLTWIPDRFWWWWRASRVIMDYDLNNRWMGDVINEFPFFSYLLSDLHPHVLAMPFNLLAVAVALNLLLGGWRGRTNLYFARLHLSKSGFFIIALVLGGLAFLNTWDILIAAALVMSSYTLAQVRRPAAGGGEAGWSWERLEEMLWLGIPLALTAFLMYLPFYIGFDSQAGGVLPSFMFPTRGAQLWVMWGTLFVPLSALLLYLWRSKAPADWRTALSTALGIVLVLLLAMFLLALIALRFKPELVLPILESQGRNVATFIADSMLRRLLYVGGLLTLLGLLAPALAFLLRSENRSLSFVLLLMALGTLLILGPDFLYLRDNFGYRINTIFKFYYQAWIVLSLAAAYASAVLLRRLRSAGRIGFTAAFALVLLVGLTYPALSLFEKTNNFKPAFGFTLDDFERIERENPDEAAAIRWLQSAPDGVVAEAVGGAYSNYARISVYTGLPTVLGWGNHEGQWRDQALQGTRAQDIESLYTTDDWAATREIIETYDIQYIYVGALERSTYAVNEEKFNSFLRPVFQQGAVTIYAAP